MVTKSNEKENEKTTEYKGDSLIYMIDADGKLHLHDLQTKKSKKGVSYVFDKKCYGCGCCKVDNRIYIAGGEVKQMDFYLRNFSVVTVSRDLNTKIHVLQNMIFEINYTTLVPLRKKYIYSIGGGFERFSIAMCERYDIDKNWWKLIHSLNEPKSFVCAFTQEDRYIYSIGGWNSEFHRLIEKYDVLCDSPWEIINVKDDSLLAVTCFDYKILFKKSENEIIVHDKGKSCSYNILLNKGSVRNFNRIDTCYNQIETVYFKGKFYSISGNSWQLVEYDFNTLNINNKYTMFY